MSERYDRSSRGGDGRDRHESDRRRNSDEGQHPSSSSARGSRGYDEADRRGGYGASSSSRGGGERRGYERDSRRRSRSRSPPRRGPPGRGEYREDRERDRRPPGAEGGSRPSYDSRDRRDDRDSRRDPRDREADDRRWREHERPDSHRESNGDRRDRGDGRSPAPVARDPRQGERQTSLSGPSVPEAVQDQRKPAASASAAGSDAGGQDEEDDDEAAMAAMLGFGGFGSSKGKKIEGNADIGISKTNQPRVIRQYMNRAGGFNRPLDRIK